MLRSMYQVNPRLCRMEGEIGVLAPGASGDLVITDGDPLANLEALADPTRALQAVVCRGRVVVDAL